MTNLITGFFKQSIIQPNQTAFRQEQSIICYSELASKVSAIAEFLTTQAPSHQRIGILMDRSIDAATVILACLHSGFCYVPLDINNPTARLDYIIKDADVCFVIGHGSKPDWIDDKQQWLVFNDLPAKATIVQPVKNFNPETLAAILYTSGTTGKPKGVALSHRAILQFSQWAADTFCIEKEDKIASLAPFFFDLSTFDLFTSLNQGATVHFVPQKLTLSPSKLTAWLKENEISVWYTVPSLLSFIALKGNLESTPLTRLRTILFAGEVFPTPQLIKLTHLLPDVAFYNLYGPTETNVCCYWPVDRTRLYPDQPIPIGKPACQAELKIAPDTHELLVKSKTNFSGYWQLGKLSKYQNPEEFYRTGDKVSVNTNDEFCYHGRLDRMMKCSGYRVEPAEIEQIINNHPGVEQSAVIAVKDPNSGQRPAAAVVLKNETTLHEVNHFLRKRLPAYMYPCKLIQMKTLPRLANGKTDLLSIEKELTMKSGL